MKVLEPKVQDVAIKNLTLDKGVQMRATLNRNAIIDYADAYEAGEKLPPIVVFWKAGGRWYVADGFHRVLAKRRLKAKTIKAEVRHGGKREAILYAARANVAHGVRRTNEDKRRAVILFLQDSEWRKWTDSTIAAACAVSAPLVAKYRSWLTPDKEARVPEVRTYIDREGRERQYTQPRSLEDKDLDRKLRLERCPYCGQNMRKG